MPRQQLVVDAARAVRDLGDVDHADRDGLAVADAVALESLDGVTERVSVVERLTADLVSVAVSRRSPATARALTAMPLVISSATIGDVASVTASGAASIRSRIVGIGDEPALHDLGEAAAQLGGGQACVRTSRSHSTPAGSWNAPTRFLPSAVLMPVLPPTAASTMPSTVVGTLTNRTPRNQLAATKPGEVGRGAAAEADDDVGAGEAELAEDLPAEREDVAVLACSLSGTSIRCTSSESATSGLRSCSACSSIAGRVDDRDAQDAESVADETAQLLVNAIADHHVVRVVGGHGEPGRHAVLLDQCDRLVGDLGGIEIVGLDREARNIAVEHAALVQQVLELRTYVAEQQRATGVHADASNGGREPDVEEDHPMASEQRRGWRG